MDAHQEEKEVTWWGNWMDIYTLPYSLHIYTLLYIDIHTLHIYSTKYKTMRTYCIAQGTLLKTLS